MDDLTLEDRTVDLQRGLVRGPAGEQRLTTTEAALLRYLAARAGEPVSRAELDREVWGHGPQVLSRALDTTVRRLRRKLEATPRTPRALLTEHGVGYRLVLPARTAPGPAPPIASPAPSVASPSPLPPAHAEVVALVGRIDPTESRAARSVWMHRLADLRAAVPALLDAGRVQEAARVAIAALRALRRVGPYDAGEPLAQQVLAAAPPRAERILLHIGAMGLCAGRRWQAHRSAVEAELAETGDPALQARAWLSFSRLGDTEACLRRALSFAQQSGAPSVLAAARGSLATHLHTLDQRESQRLFMRALADAQRAEDPWEEAIISGNFAGLLRTLGDLEGAAQRYRQSLERFAEFGDTWSQQRVWSGLSTLQHQRLRLDDAAHGYAQAIALAEELGQDEYAASARMNLACLRLDRHEEVEPAEMEQLLRAVRVYRNALYESVGMANLGIAWARRGQPTLARLHLEDALALAASVPSAIHEAEFLGELAQLDWAEQQAEAGWARMQRCIDGLDGVATRRHLRARMLLAARAEARRSGRPFPWEDELRALSERLPAVPGTAWAALAEG